MSAQSAPLAPEVENRQLIDAVLEAPEGQLKNASEGGTDTIRRRIRENGFHRLVMPYKTVSDGDLNQLPGTELPVVVEEMEPDSLGAKTINFNDTADTAFYRGDSLSVFNSVLGQIGQEWPFGIDVVARYAAAASVVEREAQVCSVNLAIGLSRAYTSSMELQFLIRFTGL